MQPFGSESEIRVKTEVAGRNTPESNVKSGYPVIFWQRMAETARGIRVNRSARHVGSECGDINAGIVFKGFYNGPESFGGVDEVVVGIENNVGCAMVDSVVAVKRLSGEVETVYLYIVAQQ